MTAEEEIRMVYAWAGQNHLDIWTYISGQAALRSPLELAEEYAKKRYWAGVEEGKRQAAK